MRSEREKITGKVAAATLRLNANRYELPPDEDTCYLLLVSEGSVTLEYEGGNVLVNPGSAVLLGPGGCRFAQTGSAVPQIVGCHFPLGMLHDLKTTAGRDFGRLFAPGERTVLYAPVQWQSRIRTLLEMMASASTEQDYPGPPVPAADPALCGAGVHCREQRCGASPQRNGGADLRLPCGQLPAEVFPHRGGGAVLSFALLPEPFVPAGNGPVHRGLHQQPPHRSGPEAAGNDRAFHQCGGRADRLCQRRPFSAGCSAR